FDTAAIDPVRNLILRGKCGTDEDQMIRRLIAASTLLDVSTPETGPWRERAREATAIHRQSLEEKLTDDGRLPDGWDNELDALARLCGPCDEDLDEFAEDDLDEFDDQEDDDEPYDDPLSEDDDAAKPIVRADPKVGRNDPCPCGSGKKFKNCCLNRQKNPPK